MRGFAKRKDARLFEFDAPCRAIAPLLLLAAASTPSLLSQELKVSELIGDAMVIQRQVNVPIWGQAAPGSSVAVRLGELAFLTQADSQGNWRIELPPLPAGGPHQLSIEAGGERIKVRDLFAGDVWVCSGQSNMEWRVADAMNAEQEIASARDPLIRQFKTPWSWAEAPQTRLAGGDWKAASPEAVGDFTAVGYFFARSLRRHVDVPIGLINTSWGGSRIEPWMSAEMLGMDDAKAGRILEAERENSRRLLERIRQRAGGLPERDEGLVDDRPLWADPALDESDWMTIEVPSAWEQAGFEGLDGIAWYRTSFELSAEEAQAGVQLGLGAIDDSDISWVNGKEVGRTEQAWNRPRLYPVPATLLQAGRNVVAVRVEDTGGGGGIHGDPKLLFVEGGGRKRPLAGQWRFRLGAVTVSPTGRQNQLPTLLYNKMIHPLLPYPIRGVLWYQGESNAGQEDAWEYRNLFASMIRGWRADWGQGDFPFLFVQLANFHSAGEEPSESSWALLRESQSAALSLPMTAQAVIIDAGEADDIHPRNKQIVGERLALAARKLSYGEEVVCSGPVYLGHQVREGRFEIEFDHLGGGLVAKGSPSGVLKGFAIAGADRQFVWAEARIKGDRAIVWSERVPDPAAVRYAWADNPQGANLYNRADLPASPFRTDDW